MNTTGILEGIETLVAARKDFVSVEMAGPNDDRYLVLHLRTETDDHLFAVHPIVTDSGVVLRVFNPVAAVVPSFIRREKLCADLNKETWFGHFVPCDKDSRIITFTIHQMVSLKFPDMTLVNLSINETLEAADSCQAIVGKIVSLAIERTQLSAEMSDAAARN
jgi:hypothetical protein